MVENQNIEWKESWRDEYLKWICRFANAQGKYAILVGEEFNSLEFYMDRDTIGWIQKNEYRRSLMEKLPKYTHENGIEYVLVGDYYIPMLTLPEEARPSNSRLSWNACFLRHLSPHSSYRWLSARK